MARDHARIFVSIWDDDDWLQGPARDVRPRRRPAHHRGADGAVLALIADQPDADTIADLLLGEAS